MSIYSIQIRDNSDNIVWDSYDVAGGVIADVRIIPGGGSGTWTYPAFVGRQVYVVNLFGVYTSDFNITCDTSLGYPRVIAGAFSDPRKIAVVVK